MKQTQSIQAEPAESVHLEHGLLRLYVAGQSPKCLAALANLRRLCAVELQGRFEIEVVDLLENPRLARGDQIVAVPTLVRKLPPPVKRIIGDLSASERVLVGLDLKRRVHP
ncbi:MAG TPA: circadian clock KaiB family protein [Terriglobales bacterium]|nr:circadian clock KaiB family protein [Terriglobales bacterium]